MIREIKFGGDVILSESGRRNQQKKRAGYRQKSD
jgi:hypothetical protein